MRNIILSALLISISFNAFAQNLTGVWKGNFNESNSSTTFNSFEIEFIKGDSGIVLLTKTYFIFQGKKYVTVCIAKMKIDKQKNTLVITEVDRINTNSPGGFSSCFQKHTLLYSVRNGKEFLKGSWETADKSMNCGNGTTELEKESAVATKPEFKLPEN